MNNLKSIEEELGNNWEIIQWELFKDQAMARSRNASPARFVRAVIIPAPKDLGF
jgi:hypothetical protein